MSNGVPEPIGPEYEPTQPAGAAGPMSRGADAGTRTAGEQTGGTQAAAQQTGASTGAESSRVGAGGGGGKWALRAQEVTYRTDDALEAAQLFHRARANGKFYSLLTDAAQVKQAWQVISGENTEAPVGWLDAFGNSYIDATRAGDLLSGTSAPEGPIRNPGYDPRGPGVEEQAEEGGAQPRLDPGASVRGGEVRGVSEKITDPAVAVVRFFIERAQGKFVRFINDRTTLEHAWRNEYGGEGPPPPAWIDGKGYLVVDAERVDFPIL